MYIVVVLLIGAAGIGLILWMRWHVNKPGVPLADCVKNPPDRLEFNVTEADGWPAPSALAEQLRRERVKNRIVELDHSDSDKYLLVRLASLPLGNGVGLGEGHPAANVVVRFDEKVAHVRGAYVVGWMSEDILEKMIREQVCTQLQIAAVALRRGEESDEPDDSKDN